MSGKSICGASGERITPIRSERADFRNYLKQGIDKKQTKPHGLARRLKRLSEKMRECVADNHDLRSYNYAIEVGLRVAHYGRMRGNSMMLGLASGEAIKQSIAGGVTFRPASRGSTDGARCHCTSPEPP
jgi:hypothetical protein